MRIITRSFQVIGDEIDFDIGAQVFAVLPHGFYLVLPEKLRFEPQVFRESRPIKILWGQHLFNCTLYIGNQTAEVYIEESKVLWFEKVFKKELEYARSAQSHLGWEWFFASSFGAIQTHEALSGKMRVTDVDGVFDFTLEHEMPMVSISIVKDGEFVTSAPFFVSRKSGDLRWISPATDEVGNPVRISELRTN